MRCQAASYGGGILLLRFIDQIYINTAADGKILPGMYIPVS